MPDSLQLFPPLDAAALASLAPSVDPATLEHLQNQDPDWLANINMSTCISRNLMLFLLLNFHTRLTSLPSLPYAVLAPLLNSAFLSALANDPNADPNAAHLAHSMPLPSPPEYSAFQGEAGANSHPLYIMSTELLASRADGPCSTGSAEVAAQLYEQTLNTLSNVFNLNFSGAKKPYLTAEQLEVAPPTPSPLLPPCTVTPFMSSPLLPPCAVPPFMSSF
jgi:hypothetical protein